MDLKYIPTQDFLHKNLKTAVLAISELKKRNSALEKSKKETDKFISKLVEEKIIEEKQKNQKIKNLVIL